MRLSRLTIFHKVILFIFLLLIPIVSLYVYSNQISVSVVRNEIRESIGRQLAFFQNQLNLQMDEISKGAFRLGNDPELKTYETILGFESFFDVIESKRRLEERINIQNNLSDWWTSSTVYFPKLKQAVSPTATIIYNERYLEEQVANRWQTLPLQANNQKKVSFFLLRGQSVFGVFGAVEGRSYRRAPICG